MPIDPSQAQYIAPDPRLHRRPMFDLIAKTFGNYFNFHKACFNGYIDHSNYDWNASRIGAVEGHVLSHYGVWGYDMRVGGAVLRCGGIGAVACHGEHRKRGLMARTASAAVEAMRQQGYDLSILFGIDNFYHRFGYVRAWSETFYFVSAADLPKEPPAAAPRKFNPRPRADIDRLHNRHNAGVTGSAVRPTFSRAFFPQWHTREGYLWTDKAGKPAGYVVVSRGGSQLHCTESAGETGQILATLALLCRKQGCQEVRFFGLPYQSDLARTLRRGNCRLEKHFRRCGGAMACLVNLESALAKMQGELSRRLEAAGLGGWRGRVLVAGKGQQATLDIKAGRVSVIPAAKCEHAIRGDESMAQLILGTDEPDEIAESAGMRFRGEGRRLMRALFPNQHPQLQEADRY